MEPNARGNCTLTSFWCGVEPKASAASTKSLGTCCMPRAVNRMAGGMAKMTVEMMAEVDPRPKKGMAGIRYTKAGRVCMKSRIGITTTLADLERAASTPTGTPTTMETAVAKRTSASVCMVGSQRRILHSSTRPSTVPKANCHRRLIHQAKPANSAMVTGMG